MPSQTKLVLIYRPRRDGSLSWPWVAGWLHTEINFRHRELNPDTVAHLTTNRARCRLTSLIEANALTATPDQKSTVNVGTRQVISDCFVRPQSSFSTLSVWCRIFHAHVLQSPILQFRIFSVILLFSNRASRRSSDCHHHARAGLQRAAAGDCTFTGEAGRVELLSAIHGSSQMSLWRCL